MANKSLSQIFRAVQSRLQSKANGGILGSVEVENDAVITHKDDYFFDTLTVVSVRRPFFAPAMIVSGALMLFAIGTFDLLYVSEKLALAVVAPSIVVAGAKLGQLKLLSRDLKNTELSGAVWGEHEALQKVRRKIVQKMQARGRHL